MIIGIDLGTTNSAVAYINNDGRAEIIQNREGERTTPSIIMFQDDEIIVGETAKDNSLYDPLNVVQMVKNQMGKKDYSFSPKPGEFYTAEELSAMILKRLKEDAENFLEEEIEGAVITVPAYYNDSQRKATMDAGQISGLNVLGIINEPTAAAISFCSGEENLDGNILVFDLGGGTFDITIMNVSENVSKIEVLATNGLRRLGGGDFDNYIINKVATEFEEMYDMDLEDDEVACQDLRLKAEKCKKLLSNMNKTNITVNSNGKLCKVSLTKEEFNKMIEKDLQKMMEVMRIAMHESGLKWEDLDKILLVGGSSRIPIIQETIEEISGIKPSHSLNPDEAVAMGAATYANILAKNQGINEKNETDEKDSMEIIDVNSHALGVGMNDIETNEYKNIIIIEENTSLPVRKSRLAYTTVENQSFIALRIYEGNDEDIEYCELVGESSINLPPGLEKAHELKIFLEYDEYGIIHAEVYDGARLLGDMEIERKSNLSVMEINKMAEKLDGKDIN